MNHFIQSLTYFRIFIAPVIFILLTLFDSYGWALILFFLASISDYWDGFLARKYNLTSEIGEILDPIADKILLVFLLISISIVTSSLYVTFMSCILICREFWVAALRDFNSRKGNVTATKVTLIAKYKTTTQFAAIFIFLYSFYVQNALAEFVAYFVLLLSLILSIQSGLIYTINSIKK
tara:strand:+ start:218 stop:754 length:537 start_codon:yes stop_codon:yes gene_type:complete